MIALSIHDRDLQELARRLRKLEDGKELRRDLVRNLREAVKPAADEAKAAIRGAPVSGARHAGEGLRAAIARGVSVQVRTSGRTVGVRVRARKITVRGFVNAPKRWNRAKGWRHPVMGDRNNWVHQVGRPGWFDDPMRRRKPEYKRAAIKAMDETARKIAGRT